ncbi:SigB/SigF/SigG family RNA polymerase sigma factor [Halonatronum saccharophilum]|uniref:SigB/SigF/SigG family RNA polymerase sigma factor n=1 Tax=Halonatronum saccharophilum TaxID=150060 RepID=UPI0004B64C6D|nr:SigB/SigF/SigG family RNA polymerase sigma factor [Halonatronum saccharophilum]
MNRFESISIKEYPLLEEDEVKSLIFDYQQGDEEAKDKLINHNLRLVLKIAHRFKNGQYSLEDIFQIGIIGLIKAIDRFDLSKEVKFSTYAVQWIIGEIKVFFRDDSLIKVSRSLKEDARRIKAVKKSLSKHLNREPTIKELSKELGMAVEDIVNALESVREPDSIHKKVYKGEDSNLELGDQIADSKDYYNAKIDSIVLKEIIKKLDSRDQLIIRFRYFEEKSQSEIAQVLGISQAQVSRLEKNIIKIIRNQFI